MLTLWLVLASIASTSQLTSLNFTQPVYNATITENSNAKTYIQTDQKMGVYITNADSADVRYKIVSSDDEKIFKLEQRTVGNFVFLLIRTKSGNTVLNRERKEKFVIVVKIVTPAMLFDTNATVNVQVLDANDLSPFFYTSKYEETVEEDKTLYEGIVRVCADDADLGMFGEVYYSFVENTSQFAINPRSGVVSLTKHLKYSEKSFHFLNILAQDRGTVFKGGGARQVKSTLVVRVKQVNLYGPQIYANNLQDIVETPKGVILTVLRVTDKDVGVHGRIESLKIVDGLEKENFKIVKFNETKNFTEFNLVLRQQLLNSKIINLTLLATDKGFPTRKTYKTITVKIPNLKSETMFQEQLKADISEHVPVHTLVIKLRTKQISGLFFEITDGNVGNTFSIDSKTGLIYTQAELDAEIRPRYILTVSVKGEGKTSNVEVRINVIDYNDNNPVFEEMEDMFVEENQSPGTAVGKVIAIDRDSAENGLVVYSISNTNVPFEIDPLTGVVRTVRVLDYETMPKEFTIRVRASDCGLPYRRESEKTVKMFLRNTNDNSPRFLKRNCLLYIAKTTQMNTVLVTMPAMDVDGDVLTYAVASGNNDSCFHIEPNSGLVILKCDFTKTNINERFLDITANDGVHVTETRLLISFLKLQNTFKYTCDEKETLTPVLKGSGEEKETLTQVSKGSGEEKETLTTVSKGSGDVKETLTNGSCANEHYPEFIDFPLEINVNETAKINAVVFKTTANDLDCGYNGELVYSLLGGDSNLKIDYRTGFVYVIDTLDYETKSKYTVNITVRDLGSPKKSAFKLLNVNIVDENDNKPIFTAYNRTVRLGRNLKPGDNVFKIEARDADFGDVIVYSLTSDFDFLKINKTTGVVFLTDFLYGDKFDVKIRATDRNGGVGSLYAEISISFIIDKEIDTPKFALDKQELGVPEDIPIGSIITICSTVGTDTKYSINGTGYFTIDESTGVVRVASALNYESKRFHSVTVEVTNSAGSSRATVFVYVINVNENIYPPEFEDIVMEVSVMENLPAGTSVVTVKATDGDAPGDDSRVGYAVTGGDGVGYFDIDEQGIIRILRALDAEVTPHFWLTVIAQDHGVVPLSSRLEVYIVVRNENDNIPLTLEPIYYARVVENSPHTLVTMVTAQDNDLYSNISFKITRGDNGGQFFIGPVTGMLTTTGPLDRETQSEYTLEVAVSDNSQPPLFSSTFIIISVEDINDNPPRFLRQDYRMVVPGLRRNISYLQVVAVDDDDKTNGDVTYSIKDGPNFDKLSIDKYSGAIYLQTSAVVGQEFDFMVIATDSGVPRQSVSTKLSVKVSDTPMFSKHSPAFEHNIINVQVEEDTKPGVVVASVQALDDDGDYLWYSITGGNTESHFALWEDKMFLVRRLDWEKHKLFHLTVMTTDGTHTAHVQVYVTVKQKKKIKIHFTQSDYKVNLSEDLTVGSHVINVTATGVPTYTIHSARSVTTLKMFAIEAGSGVVTLGGKLDRETLVEHLLIIRACVDDLCNMTHLTVNVMDVNDNAPEWLTRQSNYQVQECTNVNTTIVTLLAIDRDQGTNADITYVIIRGNFGNTLKIKPKQGELYLNKQLDISTRSEFTLIVKATDNGRPKLFTLMSLHISVVMADSQPPRFLQQDSVVEVSERVHTGTIVAHVKVRSPSLVWFEIVEGNVDRTFIINPTTGVVSIAQPLDYEMRTRYTLSITATSMAQVKAAYDLQVVVLDYNDNEPVFLNTTYFGYVLENASVGSFVRFNKQTLLMEAEDLDSGVNGLLQFDILEPTARKMFHVNSITGAIEVISTLDFETLQNVDFTVRMSDQGSPRLVSDVVATVHIQVSDVNDCSPAFSQQEYSVKVFLGLPTYSDIFILQVHATDMDSPEITTLQYSLLTTNCSCYRMDSETGEIFMTELVKHGCARFQVGVTDGIFSDSVYVNVNFENNRNTRIKFQQEVYHGAVLENSTKVTTVAVLTVLGNLLNEPLTFSLLNLKQWFSIKPTSGVVMTTGRPFDRENQEHYLLIVQVTSSCEDAQTTHASLNITVLDVNDNCPIFTHRSVVYYTVASQNAQKGDFIAKVTALDADSGENGEVKYEMTQGPAEIFRIGRKSGEVFLKQNLDPGVDEYLLNITAYDGGIISCSTNTLMMVKVMKETTPKWEKPYYHIVLPEDTRLHASLPIPLRAVGRNKVVYYISKGDENKMFYVNWETGFISLNEEVDYETIKTYNITVEAIDSVLGTSSDVVVDIQVTDVNDCYPTFTSDTYNITAPEDVQIGTKLLQVEAIDKDEGEHGAVFYKIQNRTSSSEYFSIDNAGVISAKKPLDFEKNKMHNLIIAATDRGIPALFTLTNVWITVTNVNDNVPKFEKSIYTCQLSKYGTRGQFVTHVRATDADHDLLRYSFVPGQEELLSMFCIQPETGHITLTNPKRLAKHQLIILNASVNDGVYTDICRVRIEIITPTNRKPTFTMRLYEGNITENLPAGTAVTRVIATLPGSPESHVIEYSLVAQLTAFTIDSITGEIKTMRKLDREEQAVHWLTVVAQSADNQSDWATVKVYVEDMNDNAPKFQLTKYKTCIYSSTSINTTILNIRATDLDSHPTNNVVYSIETSQPESAKLFDISLQGDLMTREPVLNYESKSVTLKVRAMDHGDPPLHTDVDVTVYVMALEDVPPIFVVPESSITLSKDTTPGNVVTQVHTNVPTHFELTCNEDWFKVDTNGQIVLLKRLTEKSYTLCILATALLLSTSMVIHLQVTGYNQSVQFDRELYTASILENSGEGTSVLKVFAEAIDSPVHYSLYPENGDFAVDPYTGWVETVVSLDRETRQHYELTIVAYVTTHPASSSASVRVSVLDVNDNPHRFSQAVYQTAVNEDAHIGTVILQLSTSDPDTHAHTMRYSIVKGDQFAQFCVTDTGQIYVCGQLDRETKDTYNLTVLATDAVFVSQCQVVVTILDVNDEPPLCTHSYYNVSLPESIPTGTSILTLEITDADMEPNFELILSGHDHNNFILEQTSKLLKTARPLDRETKSSYRLYASVTDKSWMCVSVVDLEVVDVNDNQPEFSSVSINIAEETVYALVHATDMDKGANRRIKYSLLNNDKFTVHSDTGLLRMRPPLAQYSLKVQASDQGIPQLYSATNMQISVSGKNDVTTTIVYNISLPEDTHVGTQIVLVGSLSTNKDRNNVYSIVGGNENGQFIIENTTGILRVNKQLDYETVKAYTLMVLVTNSNDALFIQKMNINILIKDCNDNAPAFIQQYSLVRIREDVAVGQQVVNVEAMDADSGDNGQLSYSIKTGNSNLQFAIDEETGVITVVKALDREVTAEYTLEIEAVDEGTPQLLNSAYVTIELVDVNDNPPVFLKPNFTAVLQEDRPAGWTVCQLRVTDADLYQNNTESAFTIISGNNEGYFRVDKEGRIVTTAKLILKLHSAYILQVRVYDPQQPSLFSDGWVTIKVVQASQHPPTVQPMDVWVIFYEGRSTIGRLTQITATDEDLYDSLSYTFVPPSPTQLFSIDQHGVINASADLEARLYELNVTVTDGRFSTHARVSVNVHFMWEEMLVNTAVVRFHEGLDQMGKLFLFLNSAVLQKVNIVSVQHSSVIDLDIMLASSEEEDWREVEETFVSAGVNVSLLTCECHNGGVCQERLKIQHESTSHVTGRNVSFVTPYHALTLHCACSFGFAGDHCEDTQCTCSSLQLCTQHTAGYICLPPCSTNTTCSASTVSMVTWEQVVAVCMSATGIGLSVLCYIGYRWCLLQYVSSRKRKPQVSLDSKSQQKCKLNNLDVSQLSNLYSQSPRNEGQTMIPLNNLDVIQSYATSTLDAGYVRKLSKVDNGYHWVATHNLRQNQAPDLAICHRNDKTFTKDVPTQNIDTVDVEEAEEVMPYGFPPSIESTQVELESS